MSYAPLKLLIKRDSRHELCEKENNTIRQYIHALNLKHHKYSMGLLEYM